MSVYFFTSTSIVTIQTIQERVLHFVVKYSVSDNDFLLLKSGVDSFGNPAIKNMANEIYRIFIDKGPNYLLSFLL